MSSNIKFSQKTLSVLANLAQINQACCLEAGKVLRTTAPDRGMVAIIKIDEEIPVDFRVYDLPNLITILKMPMFNECEISITSQLLKISNTKATQDFYAANQALVDLPPADFKPSLSDTKIQGGLSSEDLTHILQVVRAMKHDRLKFAAKDGQIQLTSYQEQGSETSNNHTLNLGATTSPDFEMSIDPSRVKMLPTDYNFSAGKGLDGVSDVIIFESIDEAKSITYMIGGVQSDN